MTSSIIRLRGKEPAVAGRIWESERRLRVGRLPGLDLYLSHHSVSRLHAEISFGAGQWLIRDLGSTNGTFLNGQPIRHIGRELHAGDLVQFGMVVLLVDGITAQVAEELPAQGQVEQEVVARSDVGGLLENLLPQLGGREMNFLLQVGRNFDPSRSLPDYLDGVLWSIAEMIQAEQVAILTTPGAGRLAWCHAVGVGGGLRPWELENHSLIWQAFTSGVSLRGSNNAQNLSVICGSLSNHAGRQLGVLFLARDLANPFGEKDLHLAAAVTLALGPTLQNMQRLFETQRQNFINLVDVLALVASWQDPAAARRSQQVREVALLLAQELQLSEAERTYLDLGVPLHDFGMLYVGNEILDKCGPLTAEERDVVKVHPLRGVEALEIIPALGPLLAIIRNHHERWDGTGYPDGLAGNCIPLLGGETCIRENRVVLPVRIELADRALPTQTGRLPVGLEVRARLSCGYASAGHVWFGELWGFVYERFLF